MMQHGIDVMENLLPRDARITIENLEQRQRLGRDIVLLVLAIFGIGEKRETLWGINGNKMEIWNLVCGITPKWPPSAATRTENQPIFFFRLNRWKKFVR